MKSYTNTFLYGSLLLFLMLSSCSTLQKPSKIDHGTKETAAMLAEKEPDLVKATSPVTLPVQYQTPSYLVGQESTDELNKSEDVNIKVGATIRSTQGKQPLWDIMKRLASLKRMNISWASDVDQNVPVDVDINATDDYNTALGNLLRQVDYYYEIVGSTIIVKYKETRQFQIAMPFVKQDYRTDVGGNVLGGRSNAGGDASNSNVSGTIGLKSDKNEFDIWDNIKLNLDTILEIWTFRREGETVTEKETILEKVGNKKITTNARKGTQTGDEIANNDNNASNKTTDNNKSTKESELKPEPQGYYIIDKPVGIITVTAPRALLEKIDNYITTLKKSLYQEVSIEAKIIEVQLDDNSSIGINWSKVLQNFEVKGAVEFGSKALGGQVYPYVFANEEGTNGKWDDGTNHGKIADPTRFVSKISLSTANFSVFLNALQEQGDTTVLSNPKISVLNGQPALITVGKNVTFIDNIESVVDPDTDIITYTVHTERILSGVGMALTATVLDKDQLILNLVPVTSELEEPILYKAIGEGSVGLPVVNVREMSTTVRVKNGEMLVIGGLISSSDSKKGSFAPGVGKIPIIKYLFGYEDNKLRKRELIILLKPTII